MPPIGDRIAERLDAIDMSQAELARQVGVKQPTINALINAGGGTKHLRKIAAVLGTSEAWLEGETDDPGADLPPQPTTAALADQFNLSFVRELELGYSMGGGSVFEAYEEKGVIPFQRDWLRSMMRGAVDDLFVARGEGDSMQPTMLDGDIVLIDTAQKDVRQQDRIWAVAYGELGMIKRVRRIPGGKYLILSDNPAVTPFEAADDEMYVIGRVIWVGRRM